MSQINTKMVQKCFQKWSQNCPKSIPKWSKNVSKMVPKLSSNGPKGSQNASKIVQTWSRNNPHLQYLSKLHINKLYPNSLNSPSLISYLHLSFSNLASIKLVLILNLFLYNKTIILFIPLIILLQFHLTSFMSRTASSLPVIYPPTHEHSHTCVFPNSPKL